MKWTYKRLDDGRFVIGRHGEIMGHVDRESLARMICDTFNRFL